MRVQLTVTRADIVPLSLHYKKSQEKDPTMSNWNATTNTTCCDGGEDVFPRSEVIALTVFSLTVFGLCSLIVIFAILREKLAFLAGTEEDVASPESREERRRKRKISISNALNIKEWVPDDPPVDESAEGDQDTPPSGEKTAEALQPPVPPINSSPASCSMGSDDCESLVGEEEMTGCAICLSHFKPEQLVCESNNSACQHVFHKDCMVDWLMKHHDSCPMCREVYVLKTV
jgi:hypothetical protein